MYIHLTKPQIARFMGPTWGPHGSCRPERFTCVVFRWQVPYKHFILTTSESLKAAVAKKSPHCSQHVVFCCGLGTLSLPISFRIASLALNVPVKQSWRMWVNSPRPLITDNITQNKTQQNHEYILWDMIYESVAQITFVIGKIHRRSN